MPPRENGLGVPGQAASDAQQLQNVRQRGANAAGQQIYNNPTTAAGMDAQHKWNQNNPIPKQSIDTVYGGVNYGNKLQKDTEVAVDQEQIGRGGPGTGNAMIRAGLLDANGYKHGTPGVNSRDTRTESAQHSQHNSVMADIKREQSNGGIQNSRVNTVNPVNRVDISGDRRREEAKNGWEKGSMDQGGANYAANGKRSAQLVQQNGPTGVPPVPLAAPTPAPVAKTTPPPAPQGGTFAPGQWNGTPGSGDPFLAKMREQGRRPDGSLNNQAPAKVAPSSGLSPEQGNALTNFQTQNNARMKAEGSTRPPDDFTKLSTGEQKYVHDFNLERGNIPRPVRPPTGQVPNPRNPNKDMNDRPMLPKAPGIPQVPVPADPAKTFNFGTGKMPNPIFPSEKEWNTNKSKGLQTDYDFKNKTENGAAASRKAAWDNGEYGNPTKFPNNPLDRKTQKAPQQQRLFGAQQVRPFSEDEKGPHPLAIQKDRQALASKGLMGAMDRAKATENGQEINHENWMPDGKGDHRRMPNLSNKKDIRGFNTSGAQQVRPRTEDAKIGVNKMPPIKKSSPITDTIKASNNPVPVVDTPKPTQQAPAQRKPLFPRLRGRR